ncbi:MAG: hypothetical protein AAF389_07215 [Gemmatimonadota bacterium]
MRALFTTLAIAFLLAPSVLEAQTRRGRATTQESAPWAPVSIGARFGYDQEVRGQTVGLSVRIPVLRDGTIELNPNLDQVIINGQDDRQYNLDVAYVPGGVRGGILLTAGLGWRDSVFGLGTVGRTRYFGYNVGAGGKTVLGRVELEALIRWTFLQDTTLQPNTVSLGVNFPLWDAPGRRPGS